MRVEYLAAAQIPHLTKLYRDYLAKSPTVSKFYAPLGANQSHSHYPKERREAVADVLLRQNKGWGASAETLKNVERLKNGAAAVVTGQQVALFGGPMFAILKAITAIKKADELTKSGADCVAIFWLASEDHDLAEVSSATLLDQSVTLRNFAVKPDAKEGLPVGDIRFSRELDGVVAEAVQTFADRESAALLRECYRPGETFTGSFAKLFASLFADLGLVLIDPSDARFHEIAKPVLQAAVEQANGLNAALLERGKELANAGYHEQVKVKPSSTVLFALQHGVRTAVHRVNGNFSIGKEKLSGEELIARIEAHPQEFSGNALFRPILQDHLLPTIAYVGGPAEVAYFAQSEVIYEKLLGRVTPILPRCSATLVDAKIERLLEKYALSVPDVFISAEELQRKIASKSLPGELRSQFDGANAALEKELSALAVGLKKLDPTLEDAAKRATSKMNYQLSRLKGRAGTAEARRNVDIVRQALLISNSLFPRNDLQERTVAGISFVGKYGLGLIRQLHDTLDLKCAGHHEIYL